MCDRREICCPHAPPLLSLHLPTSPFLWRSSVMQILWAWDWNLKRCLVWPVRVNQTVQETGSSSVSICWDSSRVLWKRLFHLAVDRFINNTAVHCRDLDSVSNRALQPMIIIINWQAYGSAILFSDVSKTAKCKTKSKKNKTSLNF